MNDIILARLQTQHSETSRHVVLALCKTMYVTLNTINDAILWTHKKILLKLFAIIIEDE